MPLTTSRMFTVRGWPPSLGAGIRAPLWPIPGLSGHWGISSPPAPFHCPHLTILPFYHTCFSNILLLIPAQKTKVTEFPDLLALAAWERLYQARLPIGGRVAASGLGNSTRKVGSNGTSLRLWA